MRYLSTFLFIVGCSNRPAQKVEYVMIGLPNLVIRCNNMKQYTSGYALTDCIMVTAEGVSRARDIYGATNFVVAPVGGE